MHFDRERVVQRMRKWEAYLNDHALPSWEELPELELYMDQVVALLNSYLGFLPKEVGMFAKKLFLRRSRNDIRVSIWLIC